LCSVLRSLLTDPCLRRLELLDKVFDVAAATQAPLHDAYATAFPAESLTDHISQYCSHALRVLGPTKLQVRTP
jgi:hypothetical protein